MDLMTLAAKIVLDDSSYVKGINNAEKLGEGLSQKMSAMTVAVGNLAADMIKKGVQSISQVIGGAIDGYADYQQLIGGVETLFKGSANKVAGYAKQSFKTTGLSANDYMETVTSFSASLLQGLKGDTDAAAEMANMAVTDMADNANKMGTDIGSIQNAYQGFAKQNYTMLDNLKLGYGGTASEMVRLVNDSKILDHEIKDLDGITFDQLVQAIHVIQTEMGITGTTAKEAAETISGSKASLEAAWSDFLTSIGGEQDQGKLEQAAKNFEETFRTYVVNNLAPAISTTLKNTPELISAVSAAITSLPSEAISDLAGKGITIVTAGVQGATDLAGWLIDGLVQLFKDAKADASKAQELGTAIGEFVGTAISDIVANAPDILGGMVNLGVNLAGGLIEGLFKGLFGEGNEVDELTEEMNDSIDEANKNAAKSSAILDYMQSLTEKYGTATTQTAEWKQALQELEQVMPDAGKVIEQYGTNVQGAIDKLAEMNRQMRITAVMDAMNDALQGQYKLLGEQTVVKTMSESRQDQAQKLIDNAIPTLISNLQTYAGEMLRLNQDMGPEMLQNYENMAKGLDSNGNPLTAYDYDGLVSMLVTAAGGLEQAYRDYGEEGETPIWDKSEADEIYSADEILDMRTVIEQAKQTVQDETALQQQLTEQITATEKEIATTELALQRTAQDVADSGVEMANGIDSGGDAVVNALEQVAAKIGTIRLPRIATDGYSYTPEATGVDTVPYNGFRAELHKGEMVLTKRKAEGYRSGAGTAEVVGAIQGMRQDLQGLRLVVGQKTFGRAVVDYGAKRTREYIGKAESREYAGHGT